MASDSCSCSLATNHKTCPLPGKTEDLYTMPSVPGYPKLRAGTQLDAIWGRMLATGKGYRRPGIKKEPGTCPGLPRVMVVFDTQCPWSHRLWDTAMILKDEIDFLWFPVCVTKDVSTAQAAAILASDTPWALTKESEELFDDPDFRGINPKDYPVTQEQRDVAWNNSHIFRKAGGTQVPLGIYRTPDNQFVPIFGDATAEEIRKIVGIG